MHSGFKNLFNINTINISNFDSQYLNQMFKFLTQAGHYFLFLKKVFSKPEKPTIYYKQTMRELVSLGLTSVGIVAIISFFMGAVITLQTAYNTENPIYPKYLIGLGCRDSMILEFSSTIAALILAGKVGSNIASEIGTMRVTEQIEHLTWFFLKS
jgi:phospholipid/cholesterol/gamma-HCH transport system permease protein